MCLVEWLLRFAKVGGCLFLCPQGFMLSCLLGFISGNDLIIAVNVIFPDILPPALYITTGILSLICLFLVKTEVKSLRPFQLWPVCL